MHQHDPTRTEESSSGFVETDGESDGAACEWTATSSSSSSVAGARQPPAGGILSGRDCPLISDNISVNDSIRKD